MYYQVRAHGFWAKEMGWRETKTWKTPLPLVCLWEKMCLYNLPWSFPFCSRLFLHNGVNSLPFLPTLLFSFRRKKTRRCGCETSLCLTLSSLLYPSLLSPQMLLRCTTDTTAVAVAAVLWNAVASNLALPPYTTSVAFVVASADELLSSILPPDTFTIFVSHYFSPYIPTNIFVTRTLSPPLKIVLMVVICPPVYPMIPRYPSTTFYAYPS